jgi:ATP-dependent helicase/nuclease subunit B
VESEDVLTAEEALQLLRVNGKQKGVVSSDETALGLLDRDLAGMPASTTSEVIPVKIKKDGGFASGSRAYSPEEIDTLIRYAVWKVRSEALEILKGKITLNPWEKGSCEYCAYKNVCGFDKKIPGCGKRAQGKEDESTLLGLMAREMGETKE